MFKVNEDYSIYCTRGDIGSIDLRAKTGTADYIFSPGDVVRFRVFNKKGCHCTVLQKDFPVLEETETVNISLDKNDTKIGEIISKPEDYWYEIELNPDRAPQTIIGYDADGAKVFKLFPEGADIEGA